MDSRMDIEMSDKDHFLMAWDFFWYLIFPCGVLLAVCIFAVIGLVKSF